MNKSQKKDLSRRIAKLEAASAASKQTAPVAQRARRLSREDKAKLDAAMGLNTEPSRGTAFDKNAHVLRLGVK
jgi:hypothetical protein